MGGEEMEENVDVREVPVVHVDGTQVGHVIKVLKHLCAQCFRLF